MNLLSPLPPRMCCSLHHCIPHSTAGPPAQDSRKGRAVYFTWRHKRDTWRESQLSDAFGQILRIPPKLGGNLQQSCILKHRFQVSFQVCGGLLHDVQSSED
jgi:hypothetical protein